MPILIQLLFLFALLFCSMTSAQDTIPSEYKIFPRSNHVSFCLINDYAANKYWIGGGIEFQVILAGVNIQYCAIRSFEDIPEIGGKKIGNVVTGGLFYELLIADTSHEFRPKFTMAPQINYRLNSVEFRSTEPINYSMVTADFKFGLILFKHVAVQYTPSWVFYSEDNIKYSGSSRYFHRASIGFTITEVWCQ